MNGKRNKDKKDIGLWISPDIIVNNNLSWPEKALYAYIRFKADTTGEYWAHDNTAADELNTPESTVKRALAKLKALGLVEGRKGNGMYIRVRMSQDWYKNKGMADCENLRGKAQSEPSNAEAQPAPVEAQLDPRPGSICTHAQAQSEPRILYTQGSNTSYCFADEEDEGDPSSSADANEKAGNHLSPLPETSQPDPTLVHLLQDEAKTWSRQVATRTAPAKVRRNKGDGTYDLVDIPASHAAGSTAADCQALLKVAQAAWPEADPLMAFRNLLHACAATKADIIRMQTYGSLYAGNDAISCRNVARIAKDCAYAIEHTAEAYGPVAPVKGAGTSELAEEIRRMVDPQNKWAGAEWTPCWLEAAARCLDTGANPRLYASAILIEARGHHRDYPLPWSATRIDLETFESCMRIYARDRAEDWQEHDVYDDKYRRCHGYRVADAVARGQSHGFRSRQCLLCSASELELMPELVANIKSWQGTAGELAAKLRDVAAATEEDTPPTPTALCGTARAGSIRTSIIRCPYATGGFRWQGYAPEYDWELEERKDREKAIALHMATSEAEQAARAAGAFHSPADPNTDEAHDTPGNHGADSEWTPKAFLERIRAEHMEEFKLE